MRSVSPTPIDLSVPDAIDFPDAMQCVIEGKRITRKAWNDRTIVVFESDGLLKIRKADGTLHALLVSDGDLHSSDWYVVKEH